MTFPTPGRPVRGSRAGYPIMALLDLLGRRWAMGILWTLCRDGPGTFRELQARCGGVSPTVLNTRLKELRQAELAERTDEEGYRATALGRELYDVLEPLKDWSNVWARALGRKR
jgi:DNA-binding HxlR family transcriptional regulator